MLKLTKTGIGLLTRQYRSVLKKCWLINVGFILGIIPHDSFSYSYDIGYFFNRYYNNDFDVDVVYHQGALAGQTGTFALEEWYKTVVAELNYIESYYATNATLGYYATTASLASASVNYANSAGSVAWSNITGKPSTFTPSAHTHAISDITNLETTLNGKQATLVSGTNIKTINGESILGSGDLTISGGANYTAGTGISLENQEISLDSNYLDNNYYRKNEKSEILNGVEAGKIGNEIGDNFSKFRAINGDFATKNVGFVLNNDSFLTNNDNFATNNGGFITNNPSRLGAFSKCEKACPRPSERFPASLEKNSAFAKYSRSARGTFLFVSQTHKNVLDSFSKLTANDNFATTTFLRAI